NLPDEKCVIFVVATSGQGELPTNMRTNWRKLLNRNLPLNLLENVAIAVFGLGDSSYAKYNFAGKKLYRRLIQLGARTILNLGLGDDQHELGIDGGFEPWREELWERIFENRFFEEMRLDFSKEELLPPRYKLEWIDENGNLYKNRQNFVENGQIVDCVSDYLPVKVLENERVTALDHFQDTRLINFSTREYENLQNNPLRYEPGDVLMVYPYNLSETVDLAQEALGYSDELLNRPFRFGSNDSNLPLPPKWIVKEITTLRICLERLFDLQMIPRRSLFELLSKISENDLEKERLKELASAQGLDDYLDYCQRPRRTVAEMLRDFPNTAKNIPPERLFDIFSTIRARAFSIASSPRAHIGKIQLLIAKVEYKVKRMASKRLGLCSNFIARLMTDDQVFVKIRSGTFRRTPADPLLMIGPGTGVAPFRSMISDLYCFAQKPPCILFFGCRNSKKDFYFEKEWPNLENLKLFTAFSRDDSEKKIYVQHKIRENANAVWNFLQLPHC
uniref:NADPH-dependent diflavin oxidoreductase 1 n=1 Tax=Acrobeloides nanus TaxID=290746 RepID=A0A914CWR3_9BILA